VAADKKIYLQIDPDGEKSCDFFDGVTWCQDRINTTDVEYFINPFSYVDITTKGCEGWLNLFFYDFPIALVNNVDLANKVRDVVPARANPKGH
jgi:beta-glucosidase/6-phospho-beta-glucosidase/beta-galactosidase